MTIDFPRSAVLDKTMGTVAIGVIAAGASTTLVPTSAFSILHAPASGVVLNQFVGRVILFSGRTNTAGLRGAQSVIRASSISNTPAFTVDALPATPVSGDIFSVV